MPHERPSNLLQLDLLGRLICDGELERTSERTFRGLARLLLELLGRELKT